MVRSSVVKMPLGGGHRGFHALSDPSARTARRAFLRLEGLQWRGIGLGLGGLGKEKMK
jgi:hypothetical protein